MMVSKICLVQATFCCGVGFGSHRAEPTLHSKVLEVMVLVVACCT